MNRIIGTYHIIPNTIIRTPEVVEAMSHGKTLLSLLDAVVHGAEPIEVLGGELDRRRMEVTGI